MNKFILMIAVVITMFSMSCSNDDEDDNDNGVLDDSIIMDLNVGNEWTCYRILGNSEENLDTIEFIFEIKKSQEFLGEKLYHYGIKGISIVVLFCNRNDGLYSYDEEEYKYYKIAKYPCEVGDFFLYGENDTVRVVSTNTEIIVDGKIYTTIHYQTIYKYGERDKIINLYMQPGIGIIKDESYEIDSNNVKSVIQIDLLKSFKKGS